MLLSAHFFSGIAAFAILRIFGLVNNNYLLLILLVVCSMLPDFDIIFSSMHRNLLTHTPLFWGSIVLAIIVINQSLWIIVFPISIHFVLDTLDYGVMLFYPFSKKKIGLALLGNENVSPSKSQCDFLREYLKNRKMVCGELIVLAITVLSTVKLLFFL
jgi:hypothetical protein